MLSEHAANLQDSLTRGHRKYGSWVNPGGRRWDIVRSDPCYVDKSGMLAVLNQMIGRPYRYIAITRPRRFGKTTDMDMIAAYYDHTVDGAAAFSGLDISKDPSFDQYRNRYHVISLDMLSSLGGGTPLTGIYNLTVHLLRELSQEFPQAHFSTDVDWKQFCASARRYTELYRANDGAENLETNPCSLALQDAFAEAVSLDDTPFVILIDEWDAYFRKFPHLDEENAFYLDFLRAILKDRIMWRLPA